MAKSKSKPKKKTNRSRLLAQITPRDGQGLNDNMNLIYQVPGVPIRIRSAEEEAKRLNAMNRRIKKKGY
jgi:hypothetical protein